MKKKIALLMAAIMIIASLPMTAFAANLTSADVYPAVTTRATKDYIIPSAESGLDETDGKYTAPNEIKLQAKDNYPIISGGFVTFQATLANAEWHFHKDLKDIINGAHADGFWVLASEGGDFYDKVGYSFDKSDTQHNFTDAATIPAAYEATRAAIAAAYIAGYADDGNDAEAADAAAGAAATAAALGTTASTAVEGNAATAAATAADSARTAAKTARAAAGADGTIADMDNYNAAEQAAIAKAYVDAYVAFLVDTYSHDVVYEVSTMDRKVAYITVKQSALEALPQAGSLTVVGTEADYWDFNTVLSVPVVAKLTTDNADATVTLSEIAMNGNRILSAGAKATLNIAAVGAAANVELPGVQIHKSLVELGEIKITETKSGSLQPGLIQFTLPRQYRFVIENESDKKAIEFKGEFLGKITPNLNDVADWMLTSNGVDADNNVLTIDLGDVFETTSVDPRKATLKITGLKIEPTDKSFVEGSYWDTDVNLKVRSLKVSDFENQYKNNEDVLDDIDGFTVDNTDGSNVKDKDGAVARFGDYELSLTLNKDEKVRTAYSGTDYVKSGEITFKEIVANSWYSRRDTTFSLVYADGTPIDPKEASISKFFILDKDLVNTETIVGKNTTYERKYPTTATVTNYNWSTTTNNNIIMYSWNPDNVGGAVDNEDLGNITFSNIQKNEKKLAQLQFRVFLKTRYDFSGDVYLRVGGTGVPVGYEPEDLLIAQFTPGITIETQTTKVTIGFQQYATKDIVIKEVAPGILKENGTLTFQFFERDNSITEDITFFNNKTAVNVASGSELALKKTQALISAKNALTVAVSRPSTKTAATITVSNVFTKIDRNVPYGEYDLLVTGTDFMLNKTYNNGDIKAEAEDDGTLYAYQEALLQNYVEVETPADPSSKSVNVVLDMSNPGEAIVDGVVQTLDLPILNINGSTYIPVRAALTFLGVPNNSRHFIWDGLAKTATITSADNNTVVTIKRDSNIMIKNGANVPMVTSDGTQYTPAVIESDSFYMPLRSLASAFNFNVGYYVGEEGMKVFFNPTVEDVAEINANGGGF